jgi:hypothetical protein
LLKYAWRRVGLTVGLTFGALALVISGCGVFGGDPPDSDRGGDRKNALATLRDSSGLFVDPTFYDSPPSVYSTALIDDALGRPASHPSDLASVVARTCRAEERDKVGKVWFSWAMATVFGSDGARCARTAEPKRNGDPGADIPTFFAWASAQVAGGTPRDQLIASGRQVVSLASAGHVGPYVMWRADQIEDLLGLPSTAATRPAPAPQELRDPDDLTELWGWTMRCGPRPELCSTPSAIDDRAVTRAAVEYSDDLSLAGALAILRAHGATELAAELTTDVERRRTKADDLLRTARFSGTIDATFEVLQLAPKLFPGPDSAITSAELVRRLAVIPPDERVKRLRALAILKAVDTTAWKRYESEITAIYSHYNDAQLGESSVKEFAEAGATFGAMGIEGPTAKLELFEARDAESVYHARLAVGGSWAFTNQDEVLKHFRKVRQDALAEAEHPAEPVVSYLAGLDALNGAGLEVSEAQRQAISQALDAALGGCDLDGVRVEQLYRFNIEKASPCSLQVTVAAVFSGFGAKE